MPLALLTWIDHLRKAFVDARTRQQYKDGLEADKDTEGLHTAPQV